ncbi:T9SS type A sorting domain-containing protein [candidate division WOR-3 bacterium]|nr:T9SS type A sorting domain-containing protein [candidate division WOR-3 bacterium]
MLHNNDIPNMTNAGKLAVHTSIACMTGAYHEGSCAAVSLLNKQGGGGIISDFNTSYGWEGILPAMGPSEYMNVWFAEAVFDSSINQIGPAFYASKNKLIPFWDINYYGGYDRNLYTLLDRTYFGDPSLCFVGTTSEVEEDLPVALVGTDVIQISLQKNWAHVQSSGFSQLKIFDVSGRMLRSSYFSDSFTVDMTSQPSGVYVFAVVSSSGTRVERLVYVK